VLGRAWVGGRSRTLGLRLGAAGMVDDAEERAGIGGTTSVGFPFFRAPPVQGLRMVGEAHAIGYVGPVRLMAQGALARESRAMDDDGNPDTPPVGLPDMVAWGVMGEVAWVVLGGPRQVGQAPTLREAAGAPWRGGALEVAGRFDRLAVGRAADDVAAGGATGGSLAVKWFPTEFLSAALTSEVLRYDRGPLETPDRTLSWTLLLRLSAYWGLGGARRPSPAKALERGRLAPNAALPKGRAVGV